ncbi:hypothetical protein B296_00025179 [Ensete ventricosum]|uniref:Uncharacterized protein n=1 Tax=Ensete ventricosum TaxID=4639 RepID=A0A427ATK5_ENSVE|nr:hypothetical protein B296_00025179 [Ensete ventricosum]
MAPPRATFHCSLATRPFELVGSEPLVRPRAIPAVGWRADVSRPGSRLGCWCPVVPCGPAPHSATAFPSRVCETGERRGSCHRRWRERHPHCGVSPIRQGP